LEFSLDSGFVGMRKQTTQRLFRCKHGSSKTTYTI
jgi:hypothetical protein